MARALSEPHKQHQSDESSEALLKRTTDAQLTASDPTVSAWVGANAGAGKTHVLKMRVLRLLLGGVKPERILCLTYTKAAAAEMAGRVFKELAQWATAPAETLANELDKVLDQTPAPGRHDHGAATVREGDRNAGRAQSSDDPRLLRAPAAAVSARSGRAAGVRDPG